MSAPSLCSYPPDTSAGRARPGLANHGTGRGHLERSALEVSWNVLLKRELLVGAGRWQIDARSTCSKGKQGQGTGRWASTKGIEPSLHGRAAKPTGALARVKTA